MNTIERVNKKKVDVSQFSQNFTKESVYILGLLWADGHIREKTKLTIINCSEVDIIDVEPVFLKTGDWLLGKSIQKTHNGKIVKNQKKISTSTWGLFEILKVNDYIVKSKSSPNKILKLIPDNLKKYWFRGYLDGDGCIKLGKKYGIEVVFTGNYEQDWEFIIDLCKQLNIKFFIDKKVVNMGKYSHFRIYKKFDVKKICDYIYSDYDNIGFSRKYAKYLNVISYIKNKEKLFWCEEDVIFLKENYEKIGGKKCSILLSKSLSSIYNKIRQLKQK